MTPSAIPEDKTLTQLSCLLSVALNPSAGDPVGQVLNSHGCCSLTGVAVDEPVPLLFSAGAERTTYRCIYLRLGAEREGYGVSAHVMAGLDERVALSTDLRNSPSVIVRQDHLGRRGGRRGRKHENEKRGKLCPGSHLRSRWLAAVTRALCELLYPRLAFGREGAPGPELRTCEAQRRRITWLQGMRWPRVVHCARSCRHHGQHGSSHLEQNCERM